MFDGLELHRLEAALFEAGGVGDLREELDRPHQVLGVAREQLVEPALPAQESLDEAAGLGHGGHLREGGMTVLRLSCDDPVTASRGSYHEAWRHP